MHCQRIRPIVGVFIAIMGLAAADSAAVADCVLLETIVLESNRADQVTNPYESSTIFESGSSYHLIAYGSYSMNYLGKRADPEWAQQNPPGWEWGEYYPSDSAPYYFEDMYDIYVNWEPFDWMGSLDADWDVCNDGDWALHHYSPEHAYRLDVVGQGETVEFFIADAYYGDNVGNITLEIWTPEPCTLSLFALGSLAMIRRR